MPRLTASSRVLYDLLSGNHRGTGGPKHKFEAPTAAGPTLVKVADPIEDIDELLDLLDTAEEVPGGKVEAKRRKGNDKRRLGIDEDGNRTLYGRKCCMELSRKLDKVIYRLRLPSDHECPECGTLWRVQMMEREERRHV